MSAAIWYQNLFPQYEKNRLKTGLPSSIIRMLPLSAEISPWTSQKIPAALHHIPMTTILRLLNAGSGGQPSRNRPLRRRPLLARFNDLGNLPVPTHSNRDLWPSAAFTAGTYLFVVSIIAFSEKGVNSFFVKKWAVFLKILFRLL